MTTEQEVRIIAREVVSEAVPMTVHQTLIGLGLDPAHPMEAQKDAQFLRSTRQRCEQAGSKAAMVMIALIVGGVITTFWKGFAGLFK